MTAHAPTKPLLAVIDYGMGNLRSVAKALEAAGAAVRVVTRPEDIEGGTANTAHAADVPEAQPATSSAGGLALGRASGLVLPGVGALADCMAALQATGFDQKIREWIAADDRPFLGICLGMQALFESSEESADAAGCPTAGLGVFPGAVRRFRLAPEYKVPHMGWNTVRFTQPDSPLVAGLATEGEAFYFVHSYYCAPSQPSLTLAECDYGSPFTAAIARGRCYATQFHPEKSQAKGLHLYRNFVRLCAGN